ncbi:MAG TPA: OmpA family protein [Candidatus Polarisedimenticolia bacterium]|nr:OmpA family protein [Candidatus Polarisedimenticolia bacterium]
MKFVARVVAILILGSFLLTQAFAEDAAKASANSTTNEASAPNASASSTAYLAPFIPMQTEPAKPKTTKTKATGAGDTYPAVDLFVGYSFVRFSTNAGAKETFNWHGITGALAGNVNRWFSLVADFGAYRIRDVPRPVSGSAYTYLFGPQFSHRGEHWTPFVHALFGAARLADIQVSTVPSGSAFFNRSFSQNSFATALGMGLDGNFNKHIGVRIFQVEYLMTKFTDGGDNKQNNLRASAGLVLHFGGNPPPPPPNHPPTVTVTANPTKVFAGSNDPIVLQAQAADPDNDPLTYKWTATGGAVEGSGAETRWNSTGVQPGKYTITATVDDGKGGTANSSADVNVEEKPNTPPTITCAANPPTITAGQRASITANAADADNDKLTYSYTTSGGKITGSGASVQFDSTGVAPGTYTVTCHVSDGRGGETDATTQVTVQPAIEQKQLEQRLSLHSIYFPTAQPTENSPITSGLLASQKKTLLALADDFKKYLAFKPDAHLILQGHADPRGGPEYNKKLSERRVERTKAYLVSEGVSADAIETQGLGIEEPMTAEQVKQAVDQEQNITAAQKAQLNRNAKVLALAQNRRVDVTLSTTGQTSVRAFPFNAEDALNLINPKGAPGTHKAPAKTAPKTGAPKTGTAKKKGAAKKQ